MPAFPLIRLEVENMKHAIIAALTDHQMQMDADIQAAVNAYCTPENIQRIIREAAFGALDAAIKEEVDFFFRRGDGRTAVAAAVKEAILQRKTYTPLDATE